MGGRRPFRSAEDGRDIRRDGLDMLLGERHHVLRVGRREGDLCEAFGVEHGDLADHAADFRDGARAHAEFEHAHAEQDRGE